MHEWSCVIAQRSAPEADRPAERAVASAIPGSRQVCGVQLTDLVGGLQRTCKDLRCMNMAMSKCEDAADVAQADTMHAGVIQCTNFTAHLGRWAVPVTRDDAEYAVCGIDGCF